MPSGSFMVNQIQWRAWNNDSRSAKSSSRHVKLCYVHVVNFVLVLIVYIGGWSYLF